MYKMSCYKSESSIKMQNKKVSYFGTNGVHQDMRSGDKKENFLYFSATRVVRKILSEFFPFMCL